MNQFSESNSLSAMVEDRMRLSLDRMRAGLQDRLRTLSRVIVEKPFRSLGVAFLSGVVIARLFQKLG